MSEPKRDLGYAYFVRKVHEVLGLDLTQYKAEQLHRRLEGLLREGTGETFFSLGRRLEREPDFAARVRDQITINVSEFFRNPDRFDELAQKILPELGRRGPLRVWSAACSIGAEPYSLAMLLLERCPPGSTVWATDIDTTVLAKARRGIYRESELRGVSAERRRRYFEEVADGYAVKPELKAIVRFQVHDLLRDRFPAPWDLIVCRNVVIYFTEEARRNLYRRFATVLRPGGVLFVGATETILYAGEVGLRPLSPSFYRKAATETDVRTDRRGGHAHGQGVGG